MLICKEDKNIIVIKYMSMMDICGQTYMTYINALIKYHMGMLASKFNGIT